MADMRRGSPESPPGMPRIQFKPGLADEMLRDLAPLLAEDGIDVDNIDVPDLDTLQHALNRAVERRNMQLFSPVGTTRDIALTTLRLTVEAILHGDTARAGTLLDTVQPESADNTVATVSSCIGIALGLLDDWLSGQTVDAPAELGERTSLPAGHWNGERAATDILVLAQRMGVPLAGQDARTARRRTAPNRLHARTRRRHRRLGPTRRHTASAAHPDGHPLNLTTIAQYLLSLVLRR